MDMHKRIQLTEMQEACAKRLYKTFPGNTPWDDVTEDIREGIRRMVTVVFVELFEQEPNAIVSFFLDGRKH